MTQFLYGQDDPFLEERISFRTGPAYLCLRDFMESDKKIKLEGMQNRLWNIQLATIANGKIEYDKPEDGKLTDITGIRDSVLKFAVAIGSTRRAGFEIGIVTGIPDVDIVFQDGDGTVRFVSVRDSDTAKATAPQKLIDLFETFEDWRYYKIVNKYPEYSKNDNYPIFVRDMEGAVMSLAKTLYYPDGLDGRDMSDVVIGRVKDCTE